MSREEMEMVSGSPRVGGVGWWRSRDETSLPLIARGGMRAMMGGHVTNTIYQPPRGVLHGGWSLSLHFPENLSAADAGVFAVAPRADLSERRG